VSLQNEPNHLLIKYDEEVSIGWSFLLSKEELRKKKGERIPAKSRTYEGDFH
jgi:hypothetical protein